MLFSFTLLFESCKKDPDLKIPEIRLSMDTSFIWKDTLQPMGSIMKFRIEAQCDEIPITNFVISFNNGKENVLLDTGIYNTTFVYDLSIYKGIADTEQWTFSVMTAQRQKASVTVQIDLQAGAQFGEIDTLEMISLGAQNNLTTRGFLSLTTYQTYFLEEAYNNQSLIDIIYYYDIYESTLSSPNDNDAPVIFTGTYGIANWTVKNESRYNLTDLTEMDFNAASNDSLLIVAYDPVNAKRKGKNAVAGDVWAFRNYEGRLGLLYIHSITGTTDGEMVISIKVQE